VWFIQGRANQKKHGPKGARKKQPNNQLGEEINPVERFGKEKVKNWLKKGNRYSGPKTQKGNLWRVQGG